LAEDEPDATVIRAMKWLIGQGRCKNIGAYDLVEYYDRITPISSADKRMLSAVDMFDKLNGFGLVVDGVVTQAGKAVVR